MGVLAAERIKLTSTRSPWWCAGLTVVYALGITAVFGLLLNVTMDAYKKDPSISPDGPPIGENLMAGLGITGVSVIPGFGYILIMILAALTVTSEYRFGTIRATFLAIPDRAKVLFAKASLVAVGAAVLTAALTFISFFILRGVTSSEVGAGLTLDGDLKVFYAVPLFAALVVFLAVGVGALIRQSAGALSLLIVWPVLIEPIIGAFGKYGRNIQVFLPFQNANHFLGLSSDSMPWHWGPWVALGWFAGFVAIVFGAALVVVRQRDA
ncbi:ABC transporter permease [Nocardia sp. IBHARD005]|uniref:ABC transporter permease n=1 Tax=Nocardia sp. IBHARD005 TaxID=3457765 RepID=UPI00405A12DA